MQDFIAEEFANYVTGYSVKDKFNAIAVLLCQIPMCIEDMQDILEILKENQDKTL